MIHALADKIATSEHPLVKPIARLLKFPFNSLQLRLLYHQKNRDVIDFIASLRKDNEVPLWNTELFQIYACALAARKLDGALAEVGVYRGATAKLISEANKGKRALHLFDTFEGLPKPDEIDTKHKEKQYACSLEFVQNYLKHYHNIAFYKGLFQQTSHAVKNIRFSFVHLDVDLYRGTFDSLGFFYSRMVRGGIILSHDYSTTPGVKAAFDEFFADKPEPLIELPTSQVLIVKL